jgi:hypothetical protein
VREYAEKGAAAEMRTKVKNLRRTFENLRGDIRSVFTSEKSPNWESQKWTQVFITLTYPYCQRDRHKVMYDFNHFWKRYTEALSGRELAYITVVEPQGSGSWHLHVMVKALDGLELWTNKEKLTKLWHKGPFSSCVKYLKSDDIGAYYTAYFTAISEEAKTGEMSIDAIDHLEELMGKVVGTDEPLLKSRLKGARLPFYDKGMKLYRRSQNCPKQDFKYVPLKELEELGFKQKYSKSYDVQTVSEDGEVETVQRTYKGTFKK